MHAPPRAHPTSRAKHRSGFQAPLCVFAENRSVPQETLCHEIRKPYVEGGA